MPQHRRRILRPLHCRCGNWRRACINLQHDLDVSLGLRTW